MDDNTNKELNEFELALISGGGTASFTRDMVATKEQTEELIRVTGVTEEEIRECLKSAGSVEVKLDPQAKPGVPSSIIITDIEFPIPPPRGGITTR